MRNYAEKIELQEELREVQQNLWDGDYRPAARESIRQLLEQQMTNYVDVCLAEIEARGQADRRNGYYPRRLQTELGDIELAVPRSRQVSGAAILQVYGRRSQHVERTILNCFLLGGSTRKVGVMLAPLLGGRVSPALVSQLAKQLDAQVTAYHRRSLKDRYRFLLFDGVVLKSKTGVGAKKRVVLVALGITADGRKEVIDFCLAGSESSGAWEGFLRDLYERGLKGKPTELVAVDGGLGLLAALEVVYPRLPVQRCWAHKTRNVLDKVRRADQPAVKQDLQKISHAKNLSQARAAARQFKTAWQTRYPKAVGCLLADLEELLAFYRVKGPKLWVQIRTTNAIERKFVEVRRRTRPMGVFSDRTSIERILFAVFSYENLKQKSSTPFSIPDTKQLT